MSSDLTVANGTEPRYPEHEKVKQIADSSQAVGEFLECSEYVLCVHDEERDRYSPVPMSVEEILAEFFDIDLAAVEREKREMLSNIRED